MKILIILFVLCLCFPVFAEPIDILETFQLDGAKAVIFSAELNISNGDPYTRDFGERGMFGKLVMGENVARSMEDYIDKSDAIFAEAKRLMIGPWENGGYTEMTFCKVGKGKKLDLETGKWVNSNGGVAIRLHHITEYMNSSRSAYILVYERTLWKKGS